MLCTMTLNSRLAASCMAGFALSLAVLATGLPMRDVSVIGLISTLSYLALNPLFIVVLLFAPHEIHDLEHSTWSQWQYPAAILVAVFWWLSVFLILRLRLLRNENKRG